MNGICKVLDCFYGAIFDPANDDWLAIKVYRDGNPIELARFSSREEAEEYADQKHRDDLAENGQFGVGA